VLPIKVKKKERAFRRCLILVGFITISILYYWLKIAFFPKNHAFLVLQEIFGHDLKGLIYMYSIQFEEINTTTLVHLP
jgi:hypothetical protein